MAKNTFILILGLAVVAAIIIGINVSRPAPPLRQGSARATPTPVPLQKPAENVPATEFTSTACGVSFIYPKTHEKFGDATTNGVFFINAQDENDTTYVGCLKSVPRPTLAPDKIEEITVASMSATLYHDTAGKNNQPINKLVFKHPTRDFEVLIVGFGSAFNQIVGTLSILP